MFEIFIAALYCLAAMYAFFRVGMSIRVVRAKTLRQKVLRTLLLILMVFGLLVSAALFTEVAVYVFAPQAEFDIL